MVPSSNGLEEMFPLRNSPEHYLQLLKQERPEWYQDAISLVQHIAITGIPFLENKEFQEIKSTVPASLYEFYNSFVTPHKNKIYLRGKRYYISISDIAVDSEMALEQLKENINRIVPLMPTIFDLCDKSRNIQERLFLGLPLDHLKHYLLNIFTAVYNTMREKEEVSAEYLQSSVDLVQQRISEYYKFIITGQTPTKSIDQAVLDSIASQIDSQVSFTSPKSLLREFDHPGRIILYSTHLLKEIAEKGEHYHLALNPLTGSAEIGETVRTFSDLLNKRVIDDVEYIRYSTKDEQHPEVINLIDLLHLAVPRQLHESFKKRIKGRNILVIDDNLGRGKTLSTIRKNLAELAMKVDITVAEISSLPIDPEKTRLTEKDLDYPPIGLWRNQKYILEDIRNLLWGR